MLTLLRARVLLRRSSRERRHTVKLRMMWRWVLNYWEVDGFSLIRLLKNSPFGRISVRQTDENRLYISMSSRLCRGRFA